MTPAERQMLDEWSTSAAVSGRHPLGQTLDGALQVTAARYHDRLAVACGDVELTYREFDNRVNQFARHLVDLGVGVGDQWSCSPVGTSCCRSCWPR